MLGSRMIPMVDIDHPDGWSRTPQNSKLRKAKLKAEDRRQWKREVEEELYGDEG